MSKQFTNDTSPGFYMYLHVLYIYFYMRLRDNIADKVGLALVNPGWWLTGTTYDPSNTSRNDP